MSNTYLIEFSRLRCTRVEFMPALIQTLEKYIADTFPESTTALDGLSAEVSHEAEDLSLKTEKTDAVKVEIQKFIEYLGKSKQIGGIVDSYRFKTPLPKELKELIEIAKLAEEALFNAPSKLVSDAENIVALEGASPQAVYQQVARLEHAIVNNQVEDRCLLEVQTKMNEWQTLLYEKFAYLIFDACNVSVIRKCARIILQTSNLELLKQYAEFISSMPSAYELKQAIEYLLDPSHYDLLSNSPRANHILATENKVILEKLSTLMLAQRDIAALKKIAAIIIEAKDIQSLHATARTLKKLDSTAEMERSVKESFDKKTALSLPVLLRFREEIDGQLDFMDNNDFFEGFYRQREHAKQYQYVMNFYENIVKRRENLEPELRGTFLHLMYLMINKTYETCESKKHELMTERAATVDAIFVEIYKWASKQWRPIKDTDLCAALADKLEKDEETFICWQQVRDLEDQVPTGSRETPMYQLYAMRNCVGNTKMDPRDRLSLLSTPKKQRKQQEYTHISTPYSLMDLLYEPNPDQLESGLAKPSTTTSHARSAVTQTIVTTSCSVISAPVAGVDAEVGSAATITIVGTFFSNTKDDRSRNNSLVTVDNLQTEEKLEAKEIATEGDYVAKKRKSHFK